MANALHITGDDLAIEHLVSLAEDPKLRVEIPARVLKVIEQGRQFLDDEMGKRVIYGVNTGFGPMASHIIGPQNLEALQENLVMSHAAGIGQPLEDRFALGAMVVRLNTIAKGYSGVTPALVEAIARFVNERIIPVIPEHGAVGTSGDLVQLAHVALALLGKGNVRFEEKIQPTAAVLKKLGIKPYILKPKEGLALINGTSAMTGIAAFLVRDAERAVLLAIRLGALALELVAAFSDGISAELHSLRPHPGQGRVAKTLRRILASSHLLRERDSLNRHNSKQEYDIQEIPEEVQEVYSIRCIAQILGPVWEAVAKARKTVEIEINSVSDNPIVDWKNKQFLHGGNFHGDVIAAAIDQLKASLVKLTVLSERRTSFFLHQRLNRLLPPFLNLQKPGLTLALQGLQFVATSTTAQSQSLAYPHHVHSIPTNADNQDVVSMGADAALLAAKVIENAFVVLTVELIAITQAVDIREIRDRLSRESRKLYDALRAMFPAVTEDRDLTGELPKVLDLLKTSPLGSTRW